MRPEFTCAYHYLKAEYAIDDLERWQIKISDLTNANDPMECKSCSLSGISYEASEMLPDIVKHRFGCICLSLSKANPILWERYTENGRGVCLGLDVKAALLHKVDYIPEAIEIAIDESIFRKACAAARLPVSRQVSKALSRFSDDFVTLRKTKFMQGIDTSGQQRHWEAEEEYRVFVTKNVAVETKYFLSFGGKVRLKEVILGKGCPIGVERINQILGGRKGIVVRRMDT